MLISPEPYRNLILDALDTIMPEYYHLETTYDPSGIVRERVFCYELYYCIRKLQEERGLTLLSLNGEIDKRGHLDFEKNDRKNPDFVFHIPGQMEGNTVIIEVKGSIADLKGIKKDLKTLVTFIRKYQYKEGYLIIYNHGFGEIVKQLQAAFENFRRTPNDIKEKIFLICKEAYGADHEMRRFSELI